MMTPQMTPRESQVMSTIHFRIDEDVKRLAMRAAERQKMTLTEVMRQRAEDWLLKSGNIRMANMMHGWKSKSRRHSVVMKPVIASSSVTMK